MGNVVFENIPTAPLIAYLRTSEKMNPASTKVVYNGLPPDEFGDELPVRSSFRRADPKEIVERGLTRWGITPFAPENSTR